MLFVEVGPNGLPIRWSSSEFPEASEEAPSDTNFFEVYFKNGNMQPLPAKPAEYLSWDLGVESWIDARSPEEIATDFSAYKLKAQDKVRSAVSVIRRNFVTEIPGQEMIYLAKENEAKTWLADPAPDLANYPLLAAEIGITAANAADLAALWITMSAQWRAAAAQLEYARLSANAAINSAPNEATVDAVVGMTLQSLQV